MSESNQGQLLEYLQSITGGEQNKINLQDLKYVVYARKSTESSERQEYSLGDQISSCKEYADRMGLTVVKIINEAESAKEPDIRPLFREMLDDIQKGKYQGIISWKPDRLARNMKEAGEIIDLLDKDIIKSLQFATFSFENTSSGKMLLGMAFVLAKQYSDQLSDTVKRGIRNRIVEGKCLNKPKHGYFKDINRFQRPDEKNFLLLKKAWKMRLEGIKYEAIADYLNKNGYERANNYGDKNKAYKWDKRRMSDLFKDPFYAGCFMYGDNVVDLSEVYDFVPIVSEEEFFKVNKLSDMKRALKSRIRASKDEKVANLLNGLVECGHCENALTAAVTRKTGGKNYFYYRCDTSGCKMKNKSVRAHILTDFVYQFLKENSFASRQSYNRYVKDAKELNRKMAKELETLIKSLNSRKVNVEKRLKETKTLVMEEQDSQIKGIFKGDLKKLSNDMDFLVDEIGKAKDEQQKLESKIITFSEFIELFKKLPSLLRNSRSLEDKDFLIRQVFLNFTIYDRKVASHRLNTPFDKFLKPQEVLSGRGGRT